MANQQLRNRAVGGKPLLDYILYELCNAAEFYSVDRTPVVQHISQSGAEDPNIVVLETHTQGWPTLEDLFKRLLALRLLALRFEEWLESKGHSEATSHSDRPRHHGQRGAFIHDQRLPPKCRRWIESGQKLLEIERKTGEPGISLVLIIVLPRIQHLYKSAVEEVVFLLQQDSYQPVMLLAQDLGDDIRRYFDFYCYSISARNPFTNPDIIHDLD